VNCYAMYRYKQLISGKVSLRNYNGQVGEILSGVWALNKISSLGTPERQEITQLKLGIGGSHSMPHLSNNAELKYNPGLQRTRNFKK
jgi:hypothetical protein